MEGADAVYPARGRRLRGPGLRARRRTMPVTFAEIKEVDEESAEPAAGGGSAGGAPPLALHEGSPPARAGSEPAALLRAGAAHAHADT